MSKKVYKWYKASRSPNATDKVIPRLVLSPMLNFYVRKREAFVGSTGTLHPEAICVWNGRHFIRFISVEEARANLVLGAKVPEEDQAMLDQDFDFYLNY